MLSPGTRLGPYEIQSVIGVGGMGEVYQARDTKLNRDVALKVLPDLFARDADRSARFLREAQVLASLNHPNIAAIYGLEESPDGVRALVLELVEGSTLAELIDSVLEAPGSDGTKTAVRESEARRSSSTDGALALDTALSIARQIADALEAAHAHQIVHRDLKPGNVKVRADGTVKVLDFGLAKALVDAATAPNLANSPTLTGATEAGVILGTAAYMSPEQARGRPVDKRTDIWSFGCVLYEMLTGRRAFEGSEATDVLARILERGPDFDALPRTTPPAILRLLRRSLEKDWNRRLPDIGVARLEIDEALTAPEAAPVSSALPARSHEPMRWQERAAWSVAVLAVLGLGTLAVFTFPSGAPEPSTMRFDVDTPPTSDAFAFALSPDGRQLAFVATADGGPTLWVRAIDQVTAQPLAGTEGASYPFWSPDGDAVGFFANGKLKRKDLTRGVPQVLADAPGGRGGTWNRDGDILFAPGATVGLKRVAATGGTPITVTELAADHGSHRWPQFLPDGRRFLFFVGLGQASARGAYVGSLDGGEPTRLLAGETAAVFAQPGYLLRVLQGVLVAHRFDAERSTVDPESRPVAQSVGTDDGTFHSAFSVSDTGVLVHRPGAGTKRQLVWVDGEGTALAPLGSVDDGVPAAPELAPDGRRVALTRAPEGTGDIWLVDVARNVASRMTFDPGVDSYPVWSPDGDRLVFSSGRNGRMDLFEKASNGATEEQPLIVTGQDTVAQDWSPDGQVLLYTIQDPKTGSDLWATLFDAARGAASNAELSPSQPFPVAQSSFDEGQGRFSPDGQWVAYASNETGRHEIYVQAFPDLSSKWQVSTGGGIYPRWRADGRELFYLAPDMRLMAVPIDVTSPPASISPRVPRALFSTRLATTGPYVFTAGVFAKAQYAVAPDGRFLMNVADDAAAPPITVVVNWTAGLTN
ncbi:MAG TPA: protein kinase [Gammaproteobacteria bacterium]